MAEPAAAREIPSVEPPPPGVQAAGAANPYQKLRGQMLVVLLLFGLIPLLAAGAAGFIANQAANEVRTRNVLEAMVKNRKATVEMFLDEKLRELQLVAAAMPVEALARPETLEALRDDMQREGGGIVDMGLIDETGHHHVYVGPYDLRDRDYHEEPWFGEVMVRGRHESDVFLGFRQFPHMVMAAKKREGGRSWVLRVTLDTDLLSRLVREGGLESGADVFILNRAGEYQTKYSDRHRLMERSDLGAVSPHSGVRVVEEVHEGRREFVATAWLKGDRWVLVARQPVPGWSALLHAHPAVMIVFVLGLIAVPILSVFISRHRLRQIRGLEAEHAALFESVAQSQKMAAIGRLAAGIAHEINNPLAIIHAQVGVLTDGLADRPDDPAARELRERLEKIAAQVERGRKVTHRLLGFSRRVGPDEEPVDVVAALEETLGFVEKEAEASNVKLVREYDPDVPIVRSSVAQMQQVFLNLVNNAMDAMRSGGSIRLGVTAADGGVRVRIADEGPGIPEKNLARVFEPFFTTKAPGSAHGGLGLAICREIMHNLGGRIWVESKVGAGTAFTLWFPDQARRAASEEVTGG